ncbi:DUF2726 domain-containing protein [Erythrobacter ani]|uniref:DUF2726 domain-containing protein n=1 Tax=Erythrobacter ani TaxID=2827235 RepID=A0ABS6SM97_9SPHN|nr:DUF2726 domain-containing protein [Erythrobacter ani]MBV7266165.1 DUF2726 domain-containing protein [Erythrobacter ani]
MIEAFLQSNTQFVLIFLAVVAVTFLILNALSDDTKTGDRSRKRPGRRNWNTGGRGQSRQISDAADQLKCVMQADFKSRALLNKSEAKVFKALDAAVIERNSNWQVMAQVSLGEFLSSPNRSAFFSVNSKRVDFALMDEQCQVVHALEYQGSGHHQGSAAARDAVKKEALRKAGIGYHEIVAGHTTPAELRALVEKLVPASR